MTLAPSLGWGKLNRLNGAQTPTAVLDRLVKALEAKDGGTVAVLRDFYLKRDSGAQLLAAVRS